MIAVSEEMKNEDLKDPSGMDQEACGETASETPKMEEAEEKTKEKAPEKEGFFKKKKDPKDEKIEELTDKVKRRWLNLIISARERKKKNPPCMKWGQKTSLSVCFQSLIILKEA